ncbi:hypothetical protein yfred0001_38360 [Yersinia frederiksenii ATCC 33641]|nr:hypothetical protein yfred0001_38360 [Yersinia frederiksenii ATCC 33641]
MSVNDLCNALIEMLSIGAICYGRKYHYGWIIREESRCHQKAQWPLLAVDNPLHNRG